MASSAPERLRDIVAVARALLDRDTAWAHGIDSFRPRRADDAA